MKNIIMIYFCLFPSLFFGQTNWVITNNNAPWSGRYAHCFINFNNQMWILGGMSSNYVGIGDIWKSSDGTNWTNVTNNTAWSARLDAVSLVYNNAMWIMGGQTSYNNSLGDVWSSSDGNLWTKKTSTPGWGPRQHSGGIVFNNKIWILGGYNGLNNTDFNDVWSSSDGIQWAQVTSHAQWSARMDLKTIVFNNYMYVFGGYQVSTSTGFNDIWKSNDGINWTKIGTLPIGMWEIVVYNQIIYSIDYNGDIYKSSNAIDWILESKSGVTYTSGTGSIIEFNNKLWMTGSGSWENKVWNYQLSTTYVPRTVNSVVVNLFPNPAENLVYINALDDNAKISIYSFDGKLIFVNNITNNKIDVRNFQSGIYTMKIETTKGTITKKFIKQ